jgi:hypothetical protein
MVMMLVAAEIGILAHMLETLHFFISHSLKFMPQFLLFKTQNSDTNNSNIVMKRISRQQDHKISSTVLKCIILI